jgi:7-cyano-7-deazaguanine synthase
MSAAVVLFSGGMDSTACLAWALENFDEVHTIGFDYGQRQAVELACREKILKLIPKMNGGWGAGLKTDRLIDMRGFAAASHSALTDHEQSIAMGASGLPTTFTPGRNILFFTLAAAMAWSIENVTNLVGGMCLTDFSGYPDCRPYFMRAMETTLQAGLHKRFEIATPLILLTKEQIWDMINRFGILELVIEESHTCYEGDHETKHAWGYGCGKCPACMLRRDGFEQWRSGV